MYSHVQEKEILEVYIERGSIEGSKMTFSCKGDEHPDMEAGDVHFVVSEKEHAVFKRNKADLTVDKKITLLEALTGFSFELTHLDGRKLLIKSEPGDVLKPSPTREPEWEVMENTGCDADSVATCQAKDIEKIKEVCIQKGFSGFTFEKSNSTCYFKQADREEMLEKKKSNKTTKGTTLYLTPDPEKQSAFRMRKCVKGEGMPLLKNSMLKGNLFIEIEIVFPDKLDKKSCDLLRKALPAPDDMDIDADSDEYEHVVLEDADPKESEQTQQFAYEDDSDDEGGHPGMGGQNVQCAQQ
jgi:DnaJ-class molecular chaperone